MTTPSPDARFRQTTPAPRAIRLGGLVVAALGLVVVVATGGGAVGIVAGLVLLAAGAVVGSLRIRITLDADAVEVALVPLRRIRIPYAAIADCTVVDHLRPRTVGGIGVRALPGGERPSSWTPGPPSPSSRPTARGTSSAARSRARRPRGSATAPPPRPSPTTPIRRIPPRPPPRLVA
ncbi:hypothetical protein [Clavibacter tessellarius]|uniref:hypothetical protein n=1 Tax=Clavibacter tessellarius TaxID=31965 RepID=UPI0032525882